MKDGELTMREAKILAFLELVIRKTYTIQTPEWHRSVRAQMLRLLREKTIKPKRKVER